VISYPALIIEPPPLCFCPADLVRYGIIMCRYRDALNSSAQATDIESGFTEAWYKQGMEFLQNEKNLQAICAFDKLLKINPQYVRAREQRDPAQKKMPVSCSFSQQSAVK
jgi:tetratricopeptide (TPR) repeat protein